MPCYNVVIVVSKMTTDTATLTAAQSLAMRFGVSVLRYVSLTESGQLSGEANAVKEAERWVLAVIATRNAMTQGYRTEVRYDTNKRVISVAGVEGVSR